MGCCANPAPLNAEILYEAPEPVADVELENALDIAGEKIVAGLGNFLRKKSKFHSDIESDLPTGILNHFGDGKDVSAAKMWKVSEDYEHEELADF